jgi:MFS family permease
MDAQERANAFRCAACDGTHGSGMGLVAALTVLPLLMNRLGAGKVELGLLAAVATAGFVVGQPFGVLLLGRRRRTKRFFIRWVLSLWVPVHLAMAGAIWFLSRSHPSLCRHAVLLLFAVVAVGDGLAVPVWVEWQSSLFRRESRGRAIGLIAGAWALGSGLGSLGGGKLQASFGFPFSYTLLFLLASVLFAASLSFMRRVQEPEWFAAGGPSVRVEQMLRFVGESLRDGNFRSYLVSRMLLALGGGAAAFYAVHFQSAEGGGLGTGTVIALGSLTALAQATSSWLLGHVGDRIGHKAGVAVGSLAQVAAIAVAYVGQGAWACAACFALLGLSWSAGWVSHVNMLLETCPHDSRVAHLALSNSIVGVFWAVVPLATGWLMERVGVRPGMGITMAPAVLGVLWLALAVREPRSVAGGTAAAGGVRI